ncbi:hypothetical protein D3C73_1578020 [compost metagenome]
MVSIASTWSNMDFSTDVGVPWMPAKADFALSLHFSSSMASCAAWAEVTRGVILAAGPLPSSSSPVVVMFSRRPAVYRLP